MKKQTFLTTLFVSIIFLSCSNDDDSTKPLAIETNQVTNLEATQSSDYTVNPPAITGDYIKFSFETGAVATGNYWDIAFRGTTILVNGGDSFGDDQPERTGNAGAYIQTGTMAGVTSVNESLFLQDSSTGLAITTGSGNGWYNYNPETHIISPIAGKILVVRTHNGKFAKLEILSYYKDMNTESGEDQHYTFNYVFQPNEGETTFE